MAGSKYAEALNRNADFDKMTKPQQRVAIAKDALEQLAIGRYVATHGIYAAPRGPNGCTVSSVLELDENGDTGPACNACAVGSLFLSKLRATKASGNVRYSSYNELAGYFEHEQLAVMEAHFERGGVFGQPAHDDADDRLRAIFENVVRNNGDFIVNDPEFLRVAACIKKDYDTRRKTENHGYCSCDWCKVDVAKYSNRSFCPQPNGNASVDFDPPF